MSRTSTVHVLAEAASPPAAPPPASLAVRRAGAVRIALQALAASVLCFAAAHVAILVADAVIRRDASDLGLFSILEAPRLWPSLASGPWHVWGSLGLGLVVYAAALATLVHRRRLAAREIAPFAWRRRLGAMPATPAARPRSATNGVAAHGVATRGVASHGAPVALAPRFASAATVPARLSFTAAWAAFAAGLGVHMVALATIERLVPAFPPVPDVVHARLPYVEFGPPGELAYAAFMAVAIALLLRRQARTVPAILVMLGLFYAVRGVFLFLLPIGIPPTAPPLGERFVFWPFAGHAYFPGGHTGMMTVLSLSIVSRPWRRALLAFTAVFAIGTLLARTHYAADAFGGWLVGYTLTLWGRRRFGALAGGIAVGRDSAIARRSREECEA